MCRREGKLGWDVGTLSLCGLRDGIVGWTLEGGGLVGVNNGIRGLRVCMDNGLIIIQIDHCDAPN